MLEVAVLYGCDLSQVFTPIILRLYQPHSLCEKAALVVFLLPPLREGQHSSVFTFDDWYLISTRAPTRGATRIGAIFVRHIVVFLLTPLREGRPRICSARGRGAAYFYSRPYARGDRYLLKLRVSDDISTRALTRGATVLP